MVEEANAVIGSIQAITQRFRTFGSICSSLTSLLMGLAAFRASPPAPASAKPSWLRTILKGVGLVSSLWTTFRSTNSPDQ
jgi:hypothetical protein